MTLAQGPVTPRRGYRRWHYAPNGSWDAERIATAMRSNPKRWSDRELLVAIVAWDELEGRPPATTDWRPSTDGGRNRWEREFPRWPPASAARIVFGSWTAMMAVAGYPPYNPPWDHIVRGSQGGAVRGECESAADGDALDAQRGQLCHRRSTWACEHVDGQTESFRVLRESC